jgi:hypothetical protein
MIAPRAPLRQRRELSQIMETALNLYGRNFSVLFRIAAVVVPLGIALGIFQTSITNEAIALPLFVLISLGQVAVNLLASAALIAALADIDAGRAPDFGRAYDVAFERFWRLAGAVLRVSFHVLLFAVTIVGIPWAIQRLVRWVFVEQAVILDSTSAKAALSYSAGAVIGSWWRTLGIWLLISLLAGVSAGLVSALFSIAPVAVSSTATAVINALVLPFVIVATTLLYFDLNARKESHDAVGAA